MLGELPVRERAHMHDADDLAVGQQRSTHQGPDALGQQHGVDDPVVVDLAEDHRLGKGRDPAGETRAERYPRTLPDLFLQAAGRICDEVTTGSVHQQHCRGIGSQRFLGPAHQLVEQRLRLQPGQRRIGD